jgi:phage tail-like protein
MDVNNTKYHLLYGERDWLPLLLEQSSSDVWWDRDRQSISLAPIVQQLGHSAGQQLDDSTASPSLTLNHRRGSAYDHYGNVYWINAAETGIDYHPAATPLALGNFWQVDLLSIPCPSNEVHGDFHSAESSTASDNPDNSALSAINIQPKLRGLAVTTQEYLVVGTLQPAGLLVFDLHAGGPPNWLCWPKQIPFSPFDISSAPDGGLWILDRDGDGADARIWHLDKTFRILDCSGEAVDLLTEYSHDFFTQGMSEPITPAQERFYSGLSLNLSILPSSPASPQNPIAVEALSANRFLVLNTSINDESSIIHYFVNGELRDSVTLNDEVMGGLLVDPQLFAQDFAFVPRSSDRPSLVVGNLYMAATHAKQSNLFSLQASDTQLTLVLEPVLLPMRGYSGKALIASAQSAYYDFGDRWLPLTEQPHLNYQLKGEVGGIIKDGEEPDCVWHRIIMDACIPSGTSVMFATRTANALEMLGDAEWNIEPVAHLRAEGSELPFYDPFAQLALEGASINREIYGSWDVLLQNAVGRFIEIRVLLAGNKRLTPRIQSCRIYYPRFSYLQRYLPAVYRDDQGSASFLDRFLANVEGLYTGLEDKIARAESLFDTRTAPSEFLDWLAGWLGALMDPAWDEQRKRLFIDNAVLLFRWRGTLLGMQALLRLCIDECPDDRIFASLNNGGAGFDQPQAAHRGTVRIVENYQTRMPPRIESQPSSPVPTQLELESLTTVWQPSFGTHALHKKYQTFLSLSYGEDIANLNNAWLTNYQQFSEIQFPPLLPGSFSLDKVSAELAVDHNIARDHSCFDFASERRDWQTFTRDFIGFTYADVSDDDLWRYQDFLQRRYRYVSQLNSAYGLIGSFEYPSFDDLLLPKVMPTNKKALQDWIEFVSLALPISQQAHRFTVLLPTVLGDLPDALELQRARVTEIVEREKPAHTSFDVKYFWAMFQIGSARLGIDSNIGDGGRFVAMVLGQNFLGKSFLQESHPWSVVDRSIVGRGRLASV